jgi:hypothetical protein
LAAIRQRAGARRSATLSRCRRAYTPTLTHLLVHAYSYTLTLTRLLVHAYSYTPTLTRLLFRTRLLLHAYSYTPTLTRLLSHAYSHTPTLTRLIVHAYSYTPTPAARVPRAQRAQARGQVAQRVEHVGPTRARRSAAGVVLRTGRDEGGGAQRTAVREGALHAAEERQVYLSIAA